MSVWIDGRAVADRDARVPVGRGLLLGDGLFETLEVRGGAPQDLEAHLARLTASAAALSVRLPDVAALLDVALAALWKAEQRPERAVLRITVTRVGGRGLDHDADALAHALLSLTPLPPRELRVPSPSVAAWIVDRPRIDPASPLAGHKLTSAQDALAARRQARTCGAERGLRLFCDGRLACADAGNVFAVLHGRLCTPAGPGILPGITRDRILRKVDVQIRDVDADELVEHAEEVFLTNSLVGVEPVHALNGRRLVAPGPLARVVAARLR